MITVIGHSVDIHSCQLFIAWDKDGMQQPDFQPSMQELLDLLMDAGYITEYNLLNHGESAEVFAYAGTRYHMPLSQFLRMEANDELCLNLLNIHVHA